MSTYLIAFVISDFPFKSNTNGNDSHSSVFRQRVYSSPNLIESTKLAVQDSERILNAIADYVHVNFSLPKMDQVAVPDLGPAGNLNETHHSLKSVCGKKRKNYFYKYSKLKRELQFPRTCNLSTFLGAKKALSNLNLPEKFIK